MSVPAERPVGRTERINLRVAPDVEAVLREAAALRNKSLTAFMLDAAYDEARVTLDEQQRTRVRAETFERLLDELDQPPRVIPELAALMRSDNPA